MNPNLLSWARRVQRRTKLPSIWLFTDTERLPDPRAAAARLPPGLGGVVLRHDRAPDRAALGRDLAQICRAKRLALVVAGDPRLAAALRAGLHLRGGRWPTVIRRRPPAPRSSARFPVTSSAHNTVELRRARLAGADLVFLSPVFPTASHPNARTLGTVRWAALARAAGVPTAALGGIDAGKLGRLPHWLCAGVGGIGFLS